MATGLHTDTSRDTEEGAALRGHGQEPQQAHDSKPKSEPGVEPIVAYRYWSIDIDPKPELRSIVSNKVWGSDKPMEAKREWNDFNGSNVFMVVIGVSSCIIVTLDLFLNKTLDDLTKLPIYLRLFYALCVVFMSFAIVATIDIFNELSKEPVPKRGSRGTHAYKTPRPTYGKSGLIRAHKTIIGGYVYLYGQVQEHKGGYRAQYAYPKSFDAISCAMCGTSGAIADMATLSLNIQPHWQEDIGRVYPERAYYVCSECAENVGVEFKGVKIRDSAATVADITAATAPFLAKQLRG